MEGTEVPTSYVTKQYPVSPIWIIITLAKALLLHNQLAFHETACQMASNHTKAIFQLFAKVPTAETAEKQQDKDKASNLDSGKVTEQFSH